MCGNLQKAVNAAKTAPDNPGLVKEHYGPIMDLLDKLMRLLELEAVPMPTVTVEAKPSEDGVSVVAREVATLGEKLKVAVSATPQPQAATALATHRALGSFGAVACARRNILADRGGCARAEYRLLG